MTNPTPEQTAELRHASDAFIELAAYEGLTFRQAKKVAEAVEELCRQATEQAEKAFGSCHNCYGKGYATIIEYVSGFTELGSSRPVKYKQPEMRFCSCERGQALQGCVAQREQLRENKGFNDAIAEVSQVLVEIEKELL